FGTPHESNIVLLAEAHGMPSRSVMAMDELVGQVDRDGPWLMCIATNRAENVAVHERLNVNVKKALAS
ncbi:MAG: hypothetical protein AAB018_05970, partial [Actinomycetota bacterium]